MYSLGQELKEKFQKLLIIENCFHCNKRYKVEIEYYRTPTGCLVIQSDLNIGSTYCYLCALQFNSRCGWKWKCCFFLFFNSIMNQLIESVATFWKILMEKFIFSKHRLSVFNISNKWTHSWMYIFPGLPLQSLNTLFIFKIVLSCDFCIIATT